MCHEKTIKDQNPLLTLRRNPYAYDIFDREKDFELEILDVNEAEKFLILKRKINGVIGYALVVEKDVLSVEELKAAYAQYQSVVSKLANNNFKEVELVIIYKEASTEVFDVIKEYNRAYIHRPPIHLVLNEVSKNQPS